MTAQWLANESFLANNLSYDRKELPFFHVDGVPLHRVGIEKELKTLIMLAVVREPGKGHLSPLKFYFNTHSKRKGGATWAKENGVHIKLGFVGVFEVHVCHTWRYECSRRPVGSSIAGVTTVNG
jgi:hypothetical protein